MRTSSVRSMTTAALLAALMAASSLFSIPIGTVPVTLQVFVVVLAGLLLPPGWAGASMAIYLLLGAVGVPVFANATGGLGILLGPTGGYLFGFVFGAILGAGVRRILEESGRPGLAADVAGALVTIVVIYAVGYAQLLLVSQLGAQGGLSPLQAFVVGVLPFVGIDAIKAAAAVLVAQALRRTGVVPRDAKAPVTAGAIESSTGA
jgi:biotin transport system substrate-specific component